MINSYFRYLNPPVPRINKYTSFGNKVEFLVISLTHSKIG